MIRIVKRLAFWVLAVCMLRLVAVYVTDTSAYFIQVMNKDLDPSLIFYTESEEALEAGKTMGDKTSNIRLMSGAKSN